MSLYACFNGQILQEQAICISPNNRSFRYGEGCFETIKVINNNILLEDLHWQRLSSSLQILRFSVPAYFTLPYLRDKILELIHINNHATHARIRVNLFKGDVSSPVTKGDGFNFIIQSFAGVAASNQLNSTGLSIDFYPDFIKSIDSFSSVKSNNYLGYAMAAEWANTNGLQDCFIYNSTGNIAESSIANVYAVIDGVIKTPSLQQGCISGVMRTYLLQKCTEHNIAFNETALSAEDFSRASEVFLSNAVFGIRWVGQIKTHTYCNEKSKLLFQKFIEPLFSSSTI